MVKIKFGAYEFTFGSRRPEMQVERGRGYKVELTKGAVASEVAWTDRRPHPTNMSNYEKWANDPEASIAYNVLSDLIAGVGYHTEMPQGIDENHKNKQIIDKYGEDTNIDEKLEEITLAMLQKGFCPVERLNDYNLKILPPETFYIYMNKKGEVYQYTQELYQGQITAKWVGSDLEDIILFRHRATTSWPYGKSLSEPIGTLLDAREQMNQDMPKAVHRWAYPGIVWETDGAITALQDAVQNRDVDEHIFIGNVREKEVRWNEIQINPQAKFMPYIELVYYQICEGLHAPLLLYLKNATEASANVMLESVDRLVNGIQRYIKRRIERYLFKPQVGEPTPRLVWGTPKTGLEDITLNDVANLYRSGAVKFNQVQDLLKKFGVDLIEPEIEPQQPMFQVPFEKPKPTMQIPTEQVLAKLNDLQTGLEIIESNFREHRISIVKAVKLAEKTISVYCKRVYPKEWHVRRNQEFDKFVRRLIQLEHKESVYEVHVKE